jgi:glutaredoxin-related protein
MSRKVAKYFMDTTENTNQNKCDFKNSKGNLKRFTTLLLKRNIRNLIRFLQVKNNKNIGIKFIKTHLKTQH